MQNPVVLITGASRGLGKELAQRLALGNYEVYAGVRDVTQAPQNTIPIFLDLRNEESLKECAHRILREKGRIDILIHNAAIAYWGAVDSMTLQESRELFEVNVFGPFRLTQLFLPCLRKQRSGKILFVSSIRGEESCAYMGMYSASKAALEAIAFDWAVTLQKWNISVSVVQPGPMDTGIDIKHGSYFSSDQENPYLPYGNVSLKPQPVSSVCDVILEEIQATFSPFKFQTDANSYAVVAKHVTDPSGMRWHAEQTEWLLNSK